MLASPALAITALIYTEVARGGFSQDWQDLLAWSGDGGLIPAADTESDESIGRNTIVALVSTLLLLIVGLANQVAMFFFWRPSRHVFATLCLVGFVATPCFGLLVAPPIEYFLTELAMFVSGITLALCYYSTPVVNRFRTTRQTGPLHKGEGPEYL